MFLRLSSIYKSFCLVSLFSFATHSGLLYSEDSCSERAAEISDLDGLGGKINHVIDQLKKSGADLKLGKKSLKTARENRILFCGPRGEKVTVAKMIAEASGSKYIYKTASDFKGSGSRVDEGAVKIKQTFKAALELADKNKQPVVIIFDGLEKITANKESLEAYLQSSANDIELCEQLDSIDNDARIFFIGIINGEDF
jgi:hypothetical protein